MNRKFSSGMGVVTLRTVILLVLTACISALSRFLFINNMFEQEYFSDQILNVWFLIFFLLIFNSLAIAINRHDKYSCERFLESVNNTKLIYGIKYIFSSFDFYLEVGCVIVLSIFLPTDFLYNFVHEIFFVGIELTTFNNKLYTLLIILPIMVLLLFVARMVIQKSWYANAQKEKSNTVKEKKSKTSPVFKSVITVAVVYCCISIMLPWLFPMFVTLWNLGGIMLFVWILLAVLASILITVMAYYVRAILKRKSFVKKLQRYSAGDSVYISDIKKPYLSLFVPQNGFDFTIEKNGKKYDCKFIAGIFPGAPIILSDNGEGLKKDTIRLFRIEMFEFLTRFNFGYESENKKILILLPTPTTFFVSNNEAPPRMADVGEKVGKYSVYNSSGFLNALGRDTL